MQPVNALDLLKQLKLRMQERKLTLASLDAFETNAADVFRGVINGNKPASPGNLFTIAKSVWELGAKPDRASVPSDKAAMFMQDFCSDLSGILERPLTAPLTWKIFRSAFYAACGLKDFDTSQGEAAEPKSGVEGSGSVPKAEGPCDAAFAGNNTLTGEELFGFFWRPFLPEAKPRSRAATIFIWDKGHHFDMLPTLEVARMFGTQTEFCPFDLDGNCMSPGTGDYSFDQYGAFCVLGRPSLYRCCDVLYDQRSRKERLPNERALFLPDVTNTTRRFMKKPLSDRSRKLFHCVMVAHPEGRVRFEAQDQVDKQRMQMVRTDYAIIQRFTLRHAGAVVILAGCTALGTFGATNQAVRERFNRVSFPQVSPDDSIEILLRVTGSVPLDGKWKPKLRPWNVRTCETLGTYVNFKVVDINNAALAQDPRRTTASALQEGL